MRVLAIDDNEGWAFLMETLIRQVYGPKVTVVRAFTYAEAKKQIDEGGPWDLVVVDYLLEMRQTCMDLLIGRGLPVVIITAARLDEVAGAASQIGARAVEKGDLPKIREAMRATAPPPLSVVDGTKESNWSILMSVMPFWLKVVAVAASCLLAGAAIATFLIGQGVGRGQTIANFEHYGSEIKRLDEEQKELRAGLTNSVVARTAFEVQMAKEIDGLRGEVRAVIGLPELSQRRWDVLRQRWGVSGPGPDIMTPLPPDATP